jgi:hypothetical protein
MLLHSSHHPRRLVLDKLKSVQELVGESIQKRVAAVDGGENKSMHKLLSGSVVQESANSADAPDVEISFLAQALNLLLH